MKNFAKNTVHLWCTCSSTATTQAAIAATVSLGKLGPAKYFVDLFITARTNDHARARRRRRFLVAARHLNFPSTMTILWPILAVAPISHSLHCEHQVRYLILVVVVVADERSKQSEEALTNFRQIFKNNCNAFYLGAAA